jgi:hypothetical protein
MTIFAIGTGTWPEWVGGLGAFLAFISTSIAIVGSTLQRRKEHAAALYDGALSVTVSEVQGSKYIVVSEDPPERTAIPQVNVTVRNGSTRPIAKLKVLTYAHQTCERLRTDIDEAESLQAGWEQTFQFDPVDEVWGRFGERPLNVDTELTFEDVEGTKWDRAANGMLRRYPLRRWWHRGAGQGRHVADGRTPP